MQFARMATRTDERRSQGDCGAIEFPLPSGTDEPGISMESARAHWICCQLGAREHYSIPRALHSDGLLGQLITDAWVPPATLRLPLRGMQRLADRYHPELQTACVQRFTADLIRFETLHRLRKTNAWTRALARNRWFQQRAIAHLQRHSPPFRPILFSYNYAALELARFAKRQGWPFVLGQMDPGRKAEQRWQSFPQGYWESWLEECQLADRIVVNSPWSAQWLQAEGIPAEKLVLLPLVYQPDESTERFQRQYPERFSADRPLRVLFLGQAIARKGIQELLQAAHRLADQPIQFLLVGAAEPALTAHSAPNLRWVGDVPRSATAAYYQQADVFLFPTHSDGFGLTQLEAQAWKLPLITSQCCGAVARHQVNGLVLPEVSGEAIAQALLTCLRDPPQLAQFAAHSGIAPEFRMEHLRQRLCHLSMELS